MRRATAIRLTLAAVAGLGLNMAPLGFSPELAADPRVGGTYIR